MTVAELVHEHASMHATSMPQISNPCVSVPGHSDFTSSINCRVSVGMQSSQVDPGPSSVFPTHLQKECCESAFMQKPVFQPPTIFYRLCDTINQEAEAAAYGSMPILHINSLDTAYAGTGLPWLGSSYSIYSPIPCIYSIHPLAALVLVFQYYTVVISCAPS